MSQSNYLLEDFFSVLSNPKRRMILQICSKESTIEQIADSLSQSQMGVKKHLHQLQKLAMLQNDNNGRFATTPVGFACMQCMGSFEFLDKHGKFFAEHNFGDTPSNLLKRIGDLKNSDFFYGIHLVLPKWSKIASEAKEFLNLIFLNPPIVIADSIKPRVSDDLQIRLLIGQNSTITECNEFVNKLDLRRLQSQRNFEKRIAESIHINVVMSEREACVIFPNNNGVTDMHGNFISTDPDFVKWCQEFFEHKWKDGVPISRLK